MGAELKLNPCTEQEQLESAFLFGETAEKGMVTPDTCTTAAAD